jgi:hypothetical protein
MILGCDEYDMIYDTIAIGAGCFLLRLFLLSRLDRAAAIVGNNYRSPPPPMMNENETDSIREDDEYANECMKGNLTIELKGNDDEVTTTKPRNSHPAPRV